MTLHETPIVLYDGKCRFCNAIVNFVISRDNKKLFRFAPIQSKEARKLLREYNEAFASLHTVYYIYNGEIKKRSRAVFGIFEQLGKPYSMFSYFRILPVFLTDAVYKFIAKNRYKWFGESDDVIVPEEKLRDRFINDFNGG